MAKGNKAFRQAVVDAPFENRLEMVLLFLGFIVFYLVDEAKQTVHFISASDTEYYHHSVDGYSFNMKDYALSLDDSENSIVQAITSGQPVGTANWDTMRRPRVDVGIARSNQASGGIGYSMIYPFTGKVRGALMYSYFQEHEAMGEQQPAFMKQYTQLVSDILEAKATNYSTL